MTQESEGNRIARERIAAEAMTRTGRLDLRNLQLSELPAELSCLHNLIELDCSGTQVSDLSPLSGLTALKLLVCFDTQVSDLSPLSGLATLQFLSCSGTKVSDLSPLSGLATLQFLSCSGTKVSDLSPLSGLTVLKRLSCSATRVSDLSPLSGLIVLQELVCHGTQVSDLSPLSSLTALQELDCSGTRVKDLFPLSGLTALQKLDCAATEVSDLSPLSGLTALQELDCTGTKVSNVSPLSGLTALQMLGCAGTQVRDLSPLSGLTALQELICYRTQVSDLSPLSGLTALQKLDCAATEVSDLSPLLSLTTLQTLDCSNCRLLHFPQELLDISTLYLYKTRIPRIPAEVLSKNHSDSCIYSLRAYLRGLKSGAVEITDTKLLILGNGRIGKTQICRQLRGETYDESVSSTHGIVVGTAALSQEQDDKPVRLHLWDFGGQDIYHGTHALFMRTRAIFLVVWVPEAEERSEYEQDGITFANHPLSYWLAYIRQLSGLDNPVLVVQARCDRPEDERRHLPVMDEALEGFRFCKLLQYSSLKNRGRAALDEALREAAAWLREQHGKDLIGQGWMRVKQQLEAEHFRQLCVKGNGDVDPSDSEYLLEYLHNTGIVFYRKGLFHDRIIIDQGWALEAIYTVFHREQCYKQLLEVRGRFTRSLLEMLAWQDYSVEEQELFLGMMQSCGICFIYQEGDPENGIEHRYIAPDLLPDKAEVTMELEERWDPHLPTVEVALEYELYQPSLLRSFVSQIGREAGINALYWKGGIYLYESITRSRALIEQEMLDGWRGVIRLQTQKGLAASLYAQLVGRLISEQTQWRVKPYDTPTKPERKFESEGEATLAEPELWPLKFVQEPSAKSEYCVSYAWGDETEEGKEREAIVDRICEAAETRGIQILRDKSDLGLGEDLLRFMQRVAHGERVFVVLSDKYLKSFNCMFELTEIWHWSRLNEEEFVRRTRLYALPEINIFDMETHERYVVYWEEKVAELKPRAHSLATKNYMKYKRMQSFVHELRDILAIIESRRMPRTFDELVQYGFTDLKS